MKLRLLALTCLLCLLPACGWEEGLPYAREMGDMALLRAMGVDGDGGGVTVTVSTGRRARGRQGEEEKPLILTAGGDSLSGACLTIQGDADQYVFYGYVEQLLVGEELTRQGLLPVLEYYARDLELGLGTQIWAVEGRAEDALSAAKEEGVEERLATMRTDSDMGAAGLTRTAGQVLSDLLEGGGSYLPLLRPTGQEAVLLEQGYVVLLGDRLAGILEAEAARGLELLEGRAPADVLEGKADGRQVLRERQAQTSFHPVFSGETLTGIEVSCHLTADLVEYDHPLTAEELDALRLQLEQRAQHRISLALNALQNWQADGVGLARKLGMAEPARWRAIQTEWEAVFPDLDIQIQVEGEIRRTGGAVPWRAWSWGGGETE